MNKRLHGNDNYTLNDLLDYCGEVKYSWLELESLIGRDYDYYKTVINSNREGWGVKYTIGSRCLCYIHPENDGIIIFFHIRTDTIEKIKDQLSEYALLVWENAYPCGDGGWIRYKLTNYTQIPEVHKLLNYKIKPKKY